MSWHPEAARRFDRLATLQHWELSSDRTHLTTAVRAPSLLALLVIYVLVSRWAPRVESRPSLGVRAGWLTITFDGMGEPLTGWDLSVAELVQVVFVISRPWR